jgi:hypothetical protein
MWPLIVAPSCTSPRRNIKSRRGSRSTLYSAAQLLLKQHRDRAEFEAAERADAMLEAGDMEGAKTWRRIMKAIKELQRPRESDEAVN